MPMLLAAILTALFIWVAENIGTFTAAWIYPHQKQGWALVSFGKLGAWFLLMILSYTMVAAVSGVRTLAAGTDPHQRRKPEPASVA